MTLTPAGDGPHVVDDPKASNGKALLLSGHETQLQAHYELPEHLAGRWRVYAVIRAQPKGAAPAALVMGIYNPNELCRLVVECPPDAAGDYRTFDLGVQQLAAGARIWIQPNGAGSYGQIEATGVDRFFLIRQED